MIFYIGSQEWEIRFVNSEELAHEWEREFEPFRDGEFLLGLTIPTTSTILINKDFPRRMFNVFNHELMHACIASYHLSKSNDPDKRCYSEEDICNFMEVCGNEYCRLVREFRPIIEEEKNAIQVKEDRKSKSGARKH